MGKLFGRIMSQHCCLMWVQHFHSLQSCHGGRDVRARSPLYRATIVSLSSLAAPSYPQRPSWLSPRMLAGSIRAQIMRTHPVLVTAASSARCYTSSLRVHGNYRCTHIGSSVRSLCGGKDAPVVCTPSWIVRYTRRHCTR